MIASTERKLFNPGLHFIFAHFVDYNKVLKTIPEYCNNSELYV